MAQYDPVVVEEMILSDQRRECREVINLNREIRLRQQHSLGRMLLRKRLSNLSTSLPPRSSEADSSRVPILHNLTREQEDRLLELLNLRSPLTYEERKAELRKLLGPLPE